MKINKSFQTFLEEKKNNAKAPIFKETDPLTPYPNDTMTSLQKSINSKAKDLDVEWHSPKELVDSTFTENNVPIPPIYLDKRWAQYKQLLDYAVTSLIDARGTGNKYII